MRAPLLLGAVLLLFPSAAAGAATPRIGQPLPDFAAKALGGESVALREALQQHKAVVVLFLSTVCPYANYFAPHIRELAKGYGARGVLFIGVNSNNWESSGEIEEHARERGFAFPMIKDERHEIADRLDARRTPEAFLVDATGTLRYRGWVKSKLESPDLQRALDAVLEGRPVRRPQTKAFGCAVDRF